jgi:GT2 family glycosyltransferase
LSVRGAALIVLAWNQWPRTKACLDSLFGSELDAARVIVVDNGSTDQTPIELAHYADRAHVVTLPANLGFVRGMNAAIAAAAPDDDVVLLNNDLVFTQTDWLGRLRDAAYTAPDIGVVGCRMLGAEREKWVYHAGGFIEGDELWGQQTESGTLERDIAQYTGTRRVQGVAFALAYIRRDCLDRIGVLDPAFHSYFEDTDYCLRAADAGIATVVAGAVTLRHEQHGSTQDDGGFRARLSRESRATFSARWQGRLRESYRGELLWQGVRRFPPAYAHLSRQLVRRLDARGLRMVYQGLDDELPGGEDHRLELAARRRWPSPLPAALMCAPGQHLAHVQGRLRVGLSFGEWERVPDTWVQAARRLDRLLVPDDFQREAFVAAGVGTPVEVLPLGIDRDYCHPRVPPLRAADGRFVFLAVVDELVRDAPDVLVTVFRRTFRPDEPVDLLLQVRPGRDATRILQALAPLTAGDPRIRVLADWNYPWYERTQLIACADACVSARRGGGWDPFAREALACGKVLVATAFGSQATLVREHGLPVEFSSVDDPRHPGTRWAEPVADSLAARLRQAFDQRTILAAHSLADVESFSSAHDIDASADQLAALILRDGRYPSGRPAAPAHRPDQQVRPASGQLVVLGMHRSGTSSVAGLLVRMGVSAGPADDLLSGPDNPKGHYESARVHMACVRRLAAAGGNWREPPSAATGVVVDAFRREMGALIDEFDAHRPWLIKEPRLCLLATELLPLLTRPVFVHVVRDPIAVARSLATRDAFDPADALALWEYYTRRAFEASEGWPRVLIDYTGLLAHPEAAAERLLDDLRSLGVGGLALPDQRTLRDWIDVPADDARSQAASAPLTDAQRALQARIADRSILAQTPSVRLRDGHLARDAR